MYGRQLANWLRERLIEKGYEVEDVIPEDWGWCVMCSRKPYYLWIGCSSVTDYDTAIPGDPPSKENVTWACFATAEVPFLKRLFKSINTEQGLSKLEETLNEIIKNEHRIKVINEP